MEALQIVNMESWHATCYPRPHPGHAGTRNARARTGSRRAGAVGGKGGRGCFGINELRVSGVVVKLDIYSALGVVRGPCGGKEWEVCERGHSADVTSVACE